VEVISYNIPGIKMHRVLVSYAAFKSHIGFYPTPGAIAAFKDELSKYQSAKGSVQFPLDNPMPLALIKKIVKYRVQEDNASGSKAAVKRATTTVKNGKPVKKKK
jgi:uncharacterized protein YdhG (YjbR/CyaY superfamily)